MILLPGSCALDRAPVTNVSLRLGLEPCPAEAPRRALDAEGPLQRAVDIPTNGQVLGQVLTGSTVMSAGPVTGPRLEACVQRLPDR